MTRRRKWWTLGITLGVVLVAGLVTAFISASILARRFEPMAREQAIRYLRDQFHCDVQLAALHVHMPKLSAFSVLLRRQRGAKVRVDGDGLVMRLKGRDDLPPLFSMRHFYFAIDLRTLLEQRKVVDRVAIEGLEINVPPKEDRPKASASPEGGGSASKVAIEEVKVNDATLVLVPRDKTREPLRFQIATLRLHAVGATQPLKYDATLTIPKPKGLVHSVGEFGPWVADDPGDTPLNGSYTFSHADLGVFNGIAGILNSTGRFDGSLGAVHAIGEADVPDFRLKMAGNPVPLVTHFDALVDGTNGNTVLKPVRARLGKTSFTTTGAVIRHEKQTRRSIDLKVIMPDGDMRDLLRLATKGPSFMEGRLKLNSSISIPPLTGTVKEKLLLDGTFAVSDARFLKSSIQSQIDNLSRRGQGKPGNQEIDQVVSVMTGAFHLENQVMTFRDLTFGVPGAAVDLNGNYDMGADTLDFHGTLKLVAKVSQTVTGWKHWALKPVDPFFAKNGAGTFLRIKVDGTSKQPKFGLDH